MFEMVSDMHASRSGLEERVDRLEERLLQLQTTLDNLPQLLNSYLQVAQQQQMQLLQQQQQMLLQFQHQQQQQHENRNLPSPLSPQTPVMSPTSPPTPPSPQSPQHPEPMLDDSPLLLDHHTTPNNPFVNTQGNATNQRQPTTMRLRSFPSGDGSPTRPVDESARAQSNPDVTSNGQNQPCFPV